MAQNRHERRKAMVFEKKMLKPSDIDKLGFVCAWDGCEASCGPPCENEYIPKGWNILLLFWSDQPPVKIWEEVPPGNMLRDAMLCPEHSRAFDGLLKPLASRLDRETQGRA